MRDERRTAAAHLRLLRRLRPGSGARPCAQRRIRSFSTYIRFFLANQPFSTYFSLKGKGEKLNEPMIDFHGQA